MRLSSVCYVLALCAPLIVADTEIRNLHLPLSGSKLPNTLLSVYTQTLRPSEQVEVTVSSSQPQVDVLLDFGARELGAAWTVRLSWPGSSPTRWNLEISSASPRSAVLHLQASPLSPRVPHPLLTRLRSYLLSLEDPPNQALDVSSFEEWHATAHIVLEPLILGVIPRTAVPAIGYITVFVLGAGMVVPSLIRLLEGAKEGLEREEIFQEKDRSE